MQNEVTSPAVHEQAPAPALAAAMAGALAANDRLTKYTALTVEATLDLGRALVEVKDGLAHGEFRQWLAANEISKDRAARAMTMHRAGVQMSQCELLGVVRAYRAARVVLGAEVTGRSRQDLQTLQDAIAVLEATVGRLRAEGAEALAENRKLRRELKEINRETARFEAELEAA